MSNCPREPRPDPSLDDGCNECWASIFGHIMLNHHPILPQPGFCQDAAYVAHVLDTLRDRVDNQARGQGDQAHSDPAQGTPHLRAPAGEADDPAGEDTQAEDRDAAHEEGHHPEGAPSHAEDPRAGPAQNPRGQTQTGLGQEDPPGGHSAAAQAGQPAP